MARGSSTEQQRTSVAPIERHIDTAVDLRIFCRVRVDLVDQSEHRTVDAVDWQHLTSTSRVRHGVERVFARRDREVAKQVQSMEAPLRICDRDSEIAAQLMVDSDIPYHLVRPFETGVHVAAASLAE